MQLEQVKAIITGGAGGIGSALAIALARAGGRVAVVDKNTENLARLERQLSDADKLRVTLYEGDVTDSERMHELVQQAADAMDGLNVMTCAAAVLIDGVVVGLGPGGVRRYALDAWKQQVDTNLTGAFVSAQLAAEHMIMRREPGCIVLFSSISRWGRPGQACYGATKAALASLATSLAHDLNPYRIRAFAIAPGLTDTDMARSVPEGRRDELLSAVLARRMGTPQEIVALTVSALSNDYINATVLDVHGGYHGA